MGSTVQLPPLSTTSVRPVSMMSSQSLGLVIVIDASQCPAAVLDAGLPDMDIVVEGGRAAIGDVDRGLIDSFSMSHR